jgi:hypothetical protein
VVKATHPALSCKAAINNCFVVWQGLSKGVIIVKKRLRIKCFLALVSKAGDLD